MKNRIISKRQLIVYMNLMMKKGKVLGKKTLSLLVLHQHYNKGTSRAYCLKEYEFSSSSSPNPGFSHMESKHKHHYFPCINAQDQVLEQQQPEMMMRLTPEISQFSIHVSDHTGMEEAESGLWQVDDEAEKFIKQFYEQLRVQWYTKLQHQEQEYQEMLARGA